MHDLDLFVEEYIDNVNYNDSELYPYDGYAVRIDAEVLDQRPAGVCVGTMCWEFEPKFTTDTYDFKSFTLTEECQELPLQYPDVDTTANDSRCESGSDYTGTGFSDCWGMQLDGEIGESSTKVTVWMWLPLELTRISPYTPTELCLFETMENTLLSDITLNGAVGSLSLIALGLLS